ncbi:MAG: hypothetical protein MJY62_06485 [Bacteroidales bacterium]|nr:hypothetical protein [Bacteroidales bacterium]MDO5443733.1 hypothetical protein [Bacteroidia bacterium]
MKTINENEKVGKPAYETVACKPVEVETQGVLCASNNDGGSLFGGLGPYSGSAL